MTSTNQPLAIRPEAPTEKTCAKCSRTLPLINFYRNSGKSDGRGAWCKDCQRAYMVQYRAKNKIRRSEYMREWRATPKGRESIRRDGERTREQRPEVIIARNAVNHAIERGDLIRLPCQFCGNPKSEAHHEDYAKPLDVIWACFVCHREKIHGQTVISKDRK